MKSVFILNWLVLMTMVKVGGILVISYLNTPNLSMTFLIGRNDCEKLVTFFGIRRLQTNSCSI